MPGPIKVRAIKPGFYNNSHVEVGAVLVIPDGEKPYTWPLFSSAWMVELSPRPVPPVKVAPKDAEDVPVPQEAPAKPVTKAKVVKKKRRTLSSLFTRKKKTK